MSSKYTMCKRCNCDILSAEGAYYIHCRDGKWHYCLPCYTNILPHIQPERSKREDLEKCTDINHGQNDRMEFFVVCQPCTQDEKRCSECIKFCIGCNGKRF